MNFDLIYLNGYGQFVWPAFIFTLANCFYLYLKTSKELKKEENLFLKEFTRFHKAETETAREEKEEREIISTVSTF